MKKAMVKEVKVNEKKVQEVVTAEGKNKSAKIKELFDMGCEVKDIAERLSIRYNFAYNVISNYVIVNDIEVSKAVRETKKDTVFQLFDAGKTLGEVSKELKMNYNYVWKLKKEWEKEVAAEAAKEVAMTNMEVAK